jgi:hypothetical protein
MVRVIPAPLLSDPGNESIGEGVGSATLEPGGKTIQCLNPQDAEACVLYADVPANEFAGGGLEPVGPVYCGFSYPADPLPCKVMVRVEKSAQVEANSAGDPSLQVLSFSSNCSPSTQGPSFCDIPMTSDQTVTATFGTATLS